MKTALNESQAGNESDDYLIELMGLKEDFPEEAMAAYGKIYSRYWDVMFTIAKRVTRDDDIAADLLSDTFNMVYNKASTFKIGKVRNPGNIRLSIQKWMATIMERIFYDHFLDDAYKKSSDGEELAESYIIDKKLIAKHVSDDCDEFIEQLEKAEQNDASDTELPSSGNEDSENLLKIREYISKLPDRDRDIVQTVYNYYIPGKYTPAAVLDDLVDKWGTTRENIRKILEKFRKAIKEELQTKMFIRK